jgi:hypothetical protein
MAARRPRTTGLQSQQSAHRSSLATFAGVVARRRRAPIRIVDARDARRHARRRVLVSDAVFGRGSCASGVYVVARLDRSHLDSTLVDPLNTRLLLPRSLRLVFLNIKTICILHFIFCLYSLIIQRLFIITNDLFFTKKHK